MSYLSKIQRAAKTTQEAKRLVEAFEALGAKIEISLRGTWVDVKDDELYFTRSWEKVAELNYRANARWVARINGVDGGVARTFELKPWEREREAGATDCEIVITGTFES